MNKTRFHVIGWIAAIVISFLIIGPAHDRWFAQGFARCYTQYGPPTDKDLQDLISELKAGTYEPAP